MSAATATIQVLAGLIGGYVTISVCESFFHRTIQHASAPLRLWYAKAGLIGRALLDAWYAHHVVHHFLTYRQSHVRQFASDAERAKLDAHLIERGHDDVIASGYGVELGREARNYARYMAPTLPIFVLVCWFGGGWFTVGALVPLCVWPMLAQFIHPYLHMRHEDAVRAAPALTRLLIGTRYFRHLARHHWLHHKHTDCNYNLLLGGDWLLGVHRTASEADREEMRAIGL